MQSASYIQTILVFLFILSFLVFIHEWGHFIAAKKSGVKVEEFAIGLGRRLWSKKVGETEYRFNLVPFGGYVRMLGEEEGSDDPRSFGRAPLFKRIWITLNGIFMNLLFTVFAFTVLFAVGHMVTIQTTGDKIVPVPQEQAYSLGDSLVSAVKETWNVSALSLQKLSELPATILKDKKIPDSVSGPLGIAQVTHYVLPNGFWAILRFAAIISLSLGVMNLLPLPALDGGRFLFQIIELLCWPFGIKVNETIEQYIHGIGFLFLIVLLLLISGNDAWRLWQSSQHHSTQSVETEQS